MGRNTQMNMIFINTSTTRPRDKKLDGRVSPREGGQPL
jgi:hypothetical protein